jgi:hypothetical protein
MFFICLRVTIPRDYMSDTEGVYRRLSTAKNASKQLSPRIFYGTGFYKRQEKNRNTKRRKKMILPWR